MSDTTHSQAGLPSISHGVRRYDRAKLLADVEATLFKRPPSVVSVGRYSLRELIGKGGFGIVYRAEDPLLRRSVAVKLLRSRAGDLSGPDALIREARMAALIEHPNVVRVYDVGRVDSPDFTDDVFVVMELLSGQPFLEWRRAEPRSARQVVELMLDVCEGLIAAHARDVVHCDIKPGNVFVLERGSAKVVDFGLALHSSQRMSSLASGSWDEEKEEGEFVAGTPGYMAPEAHEAAALEPSSDQYSFGMMLAEAIAGAHPFGHDSVDAMLRAKRRGLDRSWLREHVPPGLHGILLRATDSRPQERFVSMQAVADALREWLRPARVLPWIAAALAIPLSGAVVWGGVAATTPCGTPPPAARDAWEDSRDELRARWSDRWGDRSRTRFERRLDAFAAEWEATAERSCELELPTPCLRGKLGQLRAVLDTVTTDGDSLQHANMLAGKLGDPALCLDTESQKVLVPMPNDAGQWPDVDRIRAAIARAGAAAFAGEFETSLVLAKSARTEATTLGYAHLDAEAMHQVGLSLAADGQYAEALELLEEAYFSADGLRHEALAARAATHLVGLHADRLRDEQRARTWLRRARAAIDRLSQSHPLRAELAFNVGKLHRHAGATALARTSLEEAERRYGELDQAHERSRVLLVLGEVVALQGEDGRARALFREVFEERRESLGDKHPYTAFAQGFVARGQIMEGDLLGARESYIAAIAVLAPSVGSTHHSVASMLGNVGAIEVKLGFLEDALDHTQGALDGLRTKLPEGHLAFSVAFDNMAQAHLELGNAQEAYELDVQALDLRVQGLGPNHPHIVRSHAKIAQGLAALGRLEEAETALSRAEEGMRNAGSPAAGSQLRIAIARARLDKRPVDELRRLAKELSPDDLGRAVALFELAKLLADADPNEARAIAGNASKGFASLGAHPRAKRVDAWLQGLR